MDIVYQTVSSTQDRLRLYRFRKQVFVDEEKRWETDQDHIMDLYDSLDETVNVVALNNGEIIASLRITLDSDAGFQADQYWGFKPFRENLPGIWVNFGWLCCAREFRHTKGLIKTLVAKGAELAQKRQATDIVASIHPPVYEMLHHCFGVRQIGAPFREPGLNVEMVPIHGRVADVLSRYQAETAGMEQSAKGDPPLRNPTDARSAIPGFAGKYHFLEEALARNTGILSVAEQMRLMAMRVAIPGLGGVGGQHLVTLARLGIGAFSLAEFDVFEAVNMNRQYGARLSSLDRPKLDVMVEEALEINPYLDIRTFPGGVTPENIEAFLEGVDLVADGMDFFNIDIRRLIFSKARDRGIPVITAGPLGFSSALLIFMPGQGMDFDTYFNIDNKLSTEEKLLRFFVGLAPKATQAGYIDASAISMSGQKGPSTGAGCLMCSAVLSAEAVRILLKKPGIRPAPHYGQYDPYARRFIRGYLPMGNRHPVQRLKLRRVSRMLTQALPLDLPCPPDPSAENRTIVRFLVDAGCQAPSGDNAQPWKFAVRDNGIDVFLRPEKDTCFFNFNQMASVMACGAAVENICQAATRFGIRAVPDLLPSPENPDHLARIRLGQKQAIEESALARFVWVRHTNRTRFIGTPIPGNDLERLGHSIEDFHGARLTFMTDKKQIAALAGLIYEADLIRSRRRDLHTHLMTMIRFTREQALMTRDGLPLKNLGAGILGEAFLKLARPWPVMKLALRLGMGNRVAGAARQWAGQSSALGLITVRGKDRRAMITGGRAMERIWLTATALGFSFQPLTAITLFRARWDAGQQSDFSLPHQQRLGGIWPLFDHFFPASPDETRLFLFRLGVGRSMPCRTLRQYTGSGPDKL